MLQFGGHSIYLWYIAIAILIYVGFIAYMRHLPLDSMGMFNFYLQIATLTIFVINLLLALETCKQQTDDKNKSYYLKYANLVQLRLNDIDKMFFANSNLNRLYVQMNNNDPKLRNIPVKVTPDMIKAEYHASAIIYQVMASIYMAILMERRGKLDCQDLVQWCATFKKWLKSDVLRSHWLSFKDEQHPKFIEFVEGGGLARATCCPS